MSPATIEIPAPFGAAAVLGIVSRVRLDSPPPRGLARVVQTAVRVRLDEALKGLRWAARRAGIREQLESLAPWPAWFFRGALGLVVVVGWAPELLGPGGFATLARPRPEWPEFSGGQIGKYIPAPAGAVERRAA